MSGTEVLILTTLLTAKAQIDAAEAEADQLEAQAKVNELQGRVDAVAYKEEGTEILNNMNRVMAANAARAAAGGLDPFDSAGTLGIIQGYNMRTAVNEFTIARDNATIALKMSKFQAAQNRTAAQTVRQAGTQQALITLGGGYVESQRIGGQNQKTLKPAPKQGNTSSGPSQRPISNPRTGTR